MKLRCDIYVDNEHLIFKIQGCLTEMKGICLMSVGLSRMLGLSYLKCCL